MSIHKAECVNDVIDMTNAHSTPLHLLNRYFLFIPSFSQLEHNQYNTLENSIKLHELIRIFTPSIIIILESKIYLFLINE